MEEKLSEKIYDTLCAEIISGKIDARTFLTESEIAQRFCVSKAPVRDALHLLSSQGYLTSYPRRGYMVNIYSAKDLKQVQQVRLHMEKLCIQLAIENATDDEIESLRVEACKGSHEIDPTKTNNTKFHMSLAYLSKNEYLPPILLELLSKISIMSIDREWDPEMHNAIVDALLKRDYALAITRLEADMAD